EVSLAAASASKYKRRTRFSLRSASETLALIFNPTGVGPLNDRKAISRQMNAGQRVRLSRVCDRRLPLLLGPGRSPTCPRCPQAGGIACGHVVARRGVLDARR